MNLKKKNQQKNPKTKQNKTKNQPPFLNINGNLFLILDAGFKTTKGLHVRHYVQNKITKTKQNKTKITKTIKL
jgi:hypothetical protein